MTPVEYENLGWRLHQVLPYFLDNHLCPCDCHDRGAGYSKWLSCCVHYQEDVEYTVPAPTDFSLFRKQGLLWDTLNMLMFRPIYRVPKEKTMAEARAEIRGNK